MLPKIHISQHQEIINLNKTKSLREIAKEFKVSSDNIKKIIENNGHKIINHKAGRKPLFSKEKIVKIINLYCNELKSTAEISKHLNCASETIRNILIKNNIELRNKHEAIKIKTKFSFYPMTKEKSFLLGLIYGDGSISNRKCYVSITSGDLDILEKTQKILGNKFKIRKKKNSNCYEGIIHSVKIADELYNLFQLSNNKSDKLVFPKLEDEFYPAFISGYLATDGCISIKKKDSYLYLGFYSCSNEHLHQLNNYLCNKIQIPNRNIIWNNKNSNTNRFGNKPIYSLSFNGKFAIKACDFIFNKLNDQLWCDRKYDIYKNYISNQLIQTP